MSKANIVEKKTVSIKAILDVNEADNGEEVSISVAQTNEIA